MSTDAYRGAGRPEATYVIERLMDRIAQELNIDPVKVRRKNFPKPKEFPFKTATGLAYDSGNYQLALDKALKLAGYDKLTPRAKAAETPRPISRYRRIDLRRDLRHGTGILGIRQSRGGSSRIEVKVYSGASPHGQGQKTSFAQIVADELGVAMDDVDVIHGDTKIVAKGIGTFGSRATAVGGIAVYQAAEKVQ